VSERRAALSFVVSLILALSLAACGRNTTLPTPITPIPREISGTAEGWTGGEAVVRAVDVFNPEVPFTEGTISADGSFSLTLPVEGEELAAALGTLDKDFFCPDQSGGSPVRITPESFEGVFVGNYFYVYNSASGERLGVIYAERTPENAFNNFYASTDATVKGSCGATGNEIRFDLDFKAGWNAIFSTEDGSVLSVSTRPFPTEVTWTYESDDSSPEPEPLPPCEPDTPECAPPTPNPPASETLSGTMEQWTGEDAVIRALSYNLETDEQVVLAEGVVGDDGSFDITLPAEEGVADALFTVDEGNFCTINQIGEGDLRSTIEVVPSSVGFANLGLFVYESAYSSENEIIGDVLATDDNFEGIVNFYYAASDATIRGDCITTFGEGYSSTDTYDLDLKAGWNKVVSLFTPDGRLQSTAPVPEDIRWSFIER
jgi:hypothetical protein